jgi:hypothetical protein
MAFGDSWVDLQWTENTEPDLLGYNVLRRTTDPDDTWEKQNDKPLLEARYIDKSVTNGVTYQYKVTALDDALDEN